MKLKTLYLMAGLLAAGPALADITNTPDPYAPGYGFDMPHEATATWGGWKRGAAGTLYAEWDTFVDDSYPDLRTAAPDVGTYGVTDAHVSWVKPVFITGTGNLYSIFADPQYYTFNITGSVGSGPITRVVLQTEAWARGFHSVKLNGLDPISTVETYYDDDYPAFIGPVSLWQHRWIWELPSAPASYVFDVVGMKHQALTQFAVDIAPVPEPSVYAMLATGLGLIGLQLRRRSKIDNKVA